jgi:hypothetical protein
MQAIISWRNWFQHITSRCHNQNISRSKYTKVTKKMLKQMGIGWNTTLEKENI